MAKQILFDQAAQRALKRGVDTVADAVKVTLGPRGRNVALGKKNGTPTITHDGVTVVKEIELRDPFENMGVVLLKQVAMRTNDVAGDGTTTATLLAQAIIREGLRNIAAGANPMLLKRGFDYGVQLVLERLAAQTIPIVGKEDIAHVATVSAADEEIGNMIADALDRVGKDGVITVEESHGLRLELSVVEGMQFDNGYLSPYFVTNPEKMEVDIEDPAIFVTDYGISKLTDVIQVLEQVSRLTRNVVIIADDISGDAISTLVVNKLQGKITCLAVKAPNYGERRKITLEDIAVLTGGTMISKDSGRALESVRPNDFGKAKRVVATKDKTTIIGGQGDATAIQSRVQVIRGMLEEAVADFDREFLQQRLAKMAGGVGVIRVGAGTEVELKEKKHRIEDALNATRSAVQGGVVAGGGVALLNAAKALEGVALRGDELTGVTILRRALEEPMRQLASNAGIDGSVAIDNVRRAQNEEDKPTIGYNVLTGAYVDMIEAGVLDPVKVTRAAIENAMSIASLVLMADALVTEVPDKQLPPPKADANASYY